MTQEEKERKKQINKKWKKNHREKYLAQKKRYYEKHKDQWVNQKHKIERKYGITEEQYKIMVIQQNNKCLICGKSSNNQIRRLAIDHCHTTGKIRGLLCDNCNLGLGAFQDNPEILQSAIKYLENSLSI